MKKSLLLIVLAFVCTICQAQDIITLKDGSVLDVNVIEVTETDVIFSGKESNGVKSIISKDKVRAIQFASGQKIVFGDGSRLDKPVVPGMVYSELCKVYNPKSYQPSLDDRYQPGLSGFLSFLVPGVGQIACREGGRGAIFLLSSVVCVTGACLSRNRAGMYIGLCTAAAVDIFSIVDAVTVAKVKNMYEQDLRARRNVKVAVVPAVDCFDVNGTLQPTVGMRLAVNF